MITSRTKKKKDTPKKKRKEGHQTKWKNWYYVEVFRLAQQGFTNEEIAYTLGYTQGGFSFVIKDRPTVRRALEEARKVEGDVMYTKKGKVIQETSFKNYVYMRLPDKLKELWDKIQAVEKEPNAVRRIEAILENGGETTRKHLFLYALTARNFNTSKACRAVNISSSQLINWRTRDPEFQQLIDEIHIHKKNFFEDALIRLVRRGDSPAVLFANKTMNRDRGYNDKQEIEVHKTITHQHLVKISELGLPLEILKTILEAVRIKREAARPVPNLGYSSTNGNGHKNIVEGEFKIKPEVQERVHPLDADD